MLTSNMPVTVSDGSTKVFAGSLDKSSPAKSEESLKSLECQVDLYLPRTPPGLNILAFPASGARSSALTPHAKPPLGYTSETATLDNCEGRLDFVSFFNLADMGFSDRLRRGPSIDGASGLNLRADMPKVQG